MARVSLLAISGSLLASNALEQSEASMSSMNPIRKVVTLLQQMQKKVTEEGEKETAMFKKYMCYCKSNGGALSASIAANEAKTESLGNDIKTAEASKAQTEEALKQAQADRKSAKSAMEEATALREKEASAFAKEKGSSDANIAAINKAVAALEKGMAGFLQTNEAAVLKKLVLDKSDMNDADRQDILSFLSGSQGSDYAPASGQIVGILKELSDEMGKSLASATADEEAAIKSYDELMKAKKKEVEALIASIESKMTRIGELGVSIAQMKGDLSDSAEAIAADKEFKANLEKGCSTKEAEWEVIKKTRAEELVALADTIKVLNDDDALELFKKTLPSASSLLEVKSSLASQRSKALATLQGAMQSGMPNRVNIDLIAMALHGKKIGFGKVIKMIDAMVATLQKEQVDDDHKREYCAEQFDSADDKKKGLERAVSDAEGAIANAEEGIAATKDEIAALEAGIKELDASVAEATDNRKSEHADFTELMASDAAAKELLGFAKNRLHKFYNPKLYKAPPKVELSAEERILVSQGGTATPTPAPGGIAGTGIAVLADVSVHSQSDEKPPPPPEAPGAYKKKSEENTGVIAMIDLLIKDLDKEIAEATTAEKDAQADYEALMSDSAAKRAADSQLLTEKTATKAALEGDLQSHKEDLASGKSELAATLEYIASLHAECDWLNQYYSVRKEARATEVDALKNAKAVLSGADYSLLQHSARGFLQRSA